MQDATQAPPKAKISVLFKLGSFLLAYKPRLFGAAVALIFTAAVTLAMGEGVRVLIDEGFVGGSTAQLREAAQLIILIAVLMAIGTYVRFYLVTWLGERVSSDIRSRVFDHLLTLHPSYFEENRSGEIMSRLTTDTTLLQSVIGSSASMALRSTLTFIGGLIMLLITNLKLAAMVLLAVPMVLVPILFFGRRVRNLSRKSQDTIADVGSYAGEIIQQIKTVQSYTQEDNERKAFSGHVEKAFAVAKKRIRQRALLIAAVIALMFSGIVSMIWVGGNDVINGAMSGGELGAFVFYALIVGSAVATISEVIGEVQRAAGAAERLFELMDEESLINKPAQVQPANTLAATLDVQQVTFYYPSRPNVAALNDLSFSVAEGESVALVGPSGAGKSTIFDLLQRFYDPDRGQICLGDVPLKNLDPAELRQQIAVVAQQPTLFSGSVAHNIRYGCPQATAAQIRRAAIAAHAHDFIQELPAQYESHLGEQGVRLSGGQRQRVAIARAILKNPRILLLDEATSALDSESEYHVQQALDELMQNRTTIVIAHRLATIRNVDRIVVLEAGSIVAEGAHNDLLQSSALYRRLAELQFREGTTD